MLKDRLWTTGTCSKGCAASAKPARGVRRTARKRLTSVSTVNLPPEPGAGNWSHITGTNTGAPVRARVEKLANAVAPL
ncbi:hypothetical protein EKPJFOCH_3876 [Methylobacterium thuringiense]|uniref:Uncharacterized protein n=1 Tax=Methylobacterium thuringiense TaxID=1003091 RepID=A0ABQ4TRN1_9HYPH|nr:hypothetical protein EKPJFOCH_3876 [Methylobacterium thuringiense]